MSITLTPTEIVALTGYEKPGKQLAVLHQRGFTRAFIGKAGLVLERSHYETVTTAKQGQSARSANISFLRTA